MKKIILNIKNTAFLLIVTIFIYSCNQKKNQKKIESSQNEFLDASVYHNIRKGLQNSQIQFEHNKTGRVAFLGGSITFNCGWRDSLMVYFKNRFPKTEFDFIQAGIPSMGTTPSAFRLDRDVLSKGKIDLLFLEAAVNDEYNGRTSDEQLRAMEGIIRHLRKANPKVDIVMMHFADPRKMKAYRSNQQPKVISNHNKVANHYTIPIINLAKEVTDRIDNGEFSWEADFKDLHPSPFGQGVYARSIIKMLKNCYSNQLNDEDEVRLHPLPSKLTPTCYDSGVLVDVSSIALKTGWSLNPLWNPTDGAGTRPNYTNVPMLVSEKPNHIINIKFKGNAVGIAVAAGPDAGIIKYRIDNGEWKKQNLFTGWSTNEHLPFYYTLAVGLSLHKMHQLDIEISVEKDSKSKGNACRIRYVYVNKE